MFYQFCLSGIVGGSRVDHQLPFSWIYEGTVDGEGDVGCLGEVDVEGGDVFEDTGHSVFYF